MNTRSITATTALALALSGAAALAPAGAAPAPHAPKAGSFTVSVSVNQTAPEVGDRVTIKGTVKPAVAGSPVTLQVKYDGRTWKTIGHDQLNSAGKFKFKDKVSSVRERRYRVVKPAGGHRAAGRAKTDKVTVYGWRDLTSLKPATYSGFSEYESGVKMNGVAYPNSLRSYSAYPPGSPSTIDYNLNRECKAFRGVVGLDDSSQAASTAQVSLSTDGTQRYSGSFSLTQSAPVAFDVTKVFRLTVAATAPNGGAAVGTPEVLCSF